MPKPEFRELHVVLHAALVHPSNIPDFFPKCYATLQAHVFNLLLLPVLSESLIAIATSIHETETCHLSAPFLQQNSQCKPTL